jgi:cytochrome P450
VGTQHAPPGPKGHLLGDNLREYARDPLGFLSRCARAYGDVVRLRFMGQMFYLLSHPDLIEYVLVENNRNFIHQDENPQEKPPPARRGAVDQRGRVLAAPATARRASLPP